MADFFLGFDPGSIAELVRMAGFEALLLPEIEAAMTATGVMLVTSAQTKTWEVFANPTGRLAGSIYFYVVSPVEMIVAVGVPYGARREYGFSGMTDALGRYYPYDPGKPYLQPALDEDVPLIQTVFEAATNNALGRLAA
jgi:hypothetical protein